MAYKQHTWHQSSNNSNLTWDLIDGDKSLPKLALATSTHAVNIVSHLIQYTMFCKFSSLVGALVLFLLRRWWKHNIALLCFDNKKFLAKHTPKRAKQKICCSGKNRGNKIFGSWSAFFLHQIFIAYYRAHGHCRNIAQCRQIATIRYCNERTNGSFFYLLDYQFKCIYF